MTTNLVDRLLVQLDESVDTSAGPIVRWHRLIPEGVFYHPKYGKLDFRAPFFTKLKENFDNRVRGQDVFIDLHHEETSDAGGWILQTEYRPGDGLWGEIEWNDLGVSKVKNKRLRYLSADFGSHKDPATGQVHYPTLVAVTLTNRPYLKYDPVALSEENFDDETLEKVEFSELVEEDVALADREPSAGQQVSAKTAKKKSAKAKADAAEEEDDTAEAADDPAAENNGPRTEPAPPIAEADRDGAAHKKSTKKPAGNEGAPQPGQMRGPKPHITRGRSPDPTNEAAHMSEPTTEDTVSLADFNAQKELVDRLSTRLNEKDAESTRLAEELKAMRLREAQRDVADECRRLSETRGAIRLGETEVNAAYGIPAVVTEMYSQMALSESGFTRDGVFGLLVKLKETGTVALSERGTGASGVEHDPTITLSTRDPEDVRIFKLAESYAKADNKDIASLTLSEKEALFLRAEREVRKD